MGGLTSALGPALQIGSSLYGDKQARDQQKQSNKLAQRQAAASAAIQKESNRLTDLNAETDRRAALKRAVAKQRANFGAQGIGAGEGSSEAVLLGLFNESEDERSLRDRMAALRDTAIDQSLSNKQQLNLLQQAQLQQKQTLNRITDLF